MASRAEFETLKGRYLGRDKGLVPALFARMREIPPEERAGYGARANSAKREVEDGIARLGEALARREAERRERAAAVDVSLPGRRTRAGSLQHVVVVGRDRVGVRQAGQRLAQVREQDPEPATLQPVRS